MYSDEKCLLYFTIIYNWEKKLKTQCILESKVFILYIYLIKPDTNTHLVYNVFALYLKAILSCFIRLSRHYVKRKIALQEYNDVDVV